MQTIDTELLDVVTGGKAAPTTSHVGTKSGTLGSSDQLLGMLTSLQNSLSGLSNNNNSGFGNNNMMLTTWAWAHAVRPQHRICLEPHCLIVHRVFTNYGDS